MDFVLKTFSYLTKVAFDLYTLVIILYFLMNWFKLQSLNEAPLKDFIFSLTNVPLSFIHKIIPKIGRFDLGAICLAVFLKITEFLLLNITQGTLNVAALLVLAAAGLLMQILNLYFYLILFRLFLNWLVPQQDTLIFNTLDKLTLPFIKPIRKVIPAIGGFDAAPVVALILLQLSIFSLITPLMQFGFKLLIHN